MFKLILLTGLASITIMLPAKAATVEEFNIQAATAAVHIREEMDKLADMLGTMSKEDIDHLNKDPLASKGDLVAFTKADVLLAASDNMYAGLEALDLYVTHVVEKK